MTSNLEKPALQQEEATIAQKRIYIVDDHPMLREGLARAIARQGNWVVCGESESAAVALKEIPALQPDLVVVDISLPDKSGLELIKDLRAAADKVKILVFSMHDEMVYAERAMRAGARGYMMKGASAEGLHSAMERVLAGEIFLSPRVSAHILHNLSGVRAGVSSSHEKLTDRELEIFDLIGRGGTNHEIAEQLRISTKTVDAHRFNIRVKLGLRDAAALLREAVLWVELSTRERP